MSTLRTGNRERICLVTTGHPSTNPRLVKEADALSGAGYQVRVVACRFQPWADEADAEFQTRPWRIDRVTFGSGASTVRRQLIRTRRAVGGRLVAVLGLQAMLVHRAIHYVVPELMAAAGSEPADLFIAHNLAALPAAAAAAREHGARLGFDAEDFHRGEFADEQQHFLQSRLTRWVEERYIPECDYVTAASEGIAQSYADALGIPEPITVHNVFPQDDQRIELDEQALAYEKAPGTFSLYWFSQTVGPDRGLEDVVEALPRMGEDVVLTLRGNCRDEFRHALQARAEELGVGTRVRLLAPVPPSEMVARAACHDVGMALEPGHTENSDLAVSNKLFTYLLAGIPTVATNTTGQRRVAASMPGAVTLVTPGDVDGLVASVRDLRSRMPEARLAASLAAEVWNWDVERARFLEVVENVLAARKS